MSEKLRKIFVSAVNSEEARVGDNALKNEEENDSEKEEKLVSRREAIKDFVDRSTLHGLQYVCNSRSKVHSFVWIMLMLVATGYVVNILTISISKYAEYPVKTKTTMMLTDNSVFPAVTICNFNRHRQSPLKNTSYENIFETYQFAILKGDKTWEYNFTEINMTKLETMVAHQLEDMLMTCD